MNNFELEVCIESVESALAAKRGGATRLEVCADLVIGGTTPGLCLYDEIRKNCDIKMHMLIRPRYGDFLYTEHEFAIMKNAIIRFRESGAEGVVIGMLKKDGTLDKERMRELIACAGDMRVTLHRAFDVCREPYEALETAIDLGVDTILTSGQQNSAKEGIELLTKLVERSAGRIEIMPGSGVNAEIIKELYERTGATAYHMSGRMVYDSKMEYRKAGVSMGIPTISEYELGITDEEKIHNARKVLEAL